MAKQKLIVTFGLPRINRENAEKRMEIAKWVFDAIGHEHTPVGQPLWIVSDERHKVTYRFAREEDATMTSLRFSEYLFREVFLDDMTL